MNTITSKQIGIAATVGNHAHADSAAARVALPTAWTVLKLTYGIVPIVAGLDKFTNLLVNWEQYLNPMILNVVPLSGRAFMGVVGVIEMAAGILVLARPRIGAPVVAAWLACIALSLLAGGHYLDVAVRDLVMAVGAFALASLTPAARTAQG